MSAPRGPGRPTGPPPSNDGDASRQPGSIKAARERMARERLQEGGTDDQQRPPPRIQQQAPARRPPPLNAQPTTSRGPPPSMPAASPSPNSPQWPLRNDSGQLGPSVGRPMYAPQRPPRPTYVPSILDPTKPPTFDDAPGQDPRRRPPPGAVPAAGPPPQQALPSRPQMRPGPSRPLQVNDGATLQPPPNPTPRSGPSQQQAFADEDLLSPSSSLYPSPRYNRPLTDASGTSTGTSSSLGSIPDFPIVQTPTDPNLPQQQPPPRSQFRPPPGSSQQPVAPLRPQGAPPAQAPPRQPQMQDPYSLTQVALGPPPSQLQPLPASVFAQQRRIPALGPPPSARRGPLSYYSNTSYVSPIAEESEGGISRSSYASSTAIPGRNGFYYDDDDGTELESDYGDPRRSQIATATAAASMTAGPGLVREASIGKKARPALTTIRSGDNLRGANGDDGQVTPRASNTPPKTPANGEDGRDMLPSQQRRKASTEEARAAAAGPIATSSRKVGPVAAAVAGVAGVAAAGTLAAAAPSRSRTETPTNELSGGTGWVDHSSDDSMSPDDEKDMEEAFATKQALSPPPLTPRGPKQPMQSPVDPRVAAIMNNLERNGPISPASPPLQTGRNSAYERAGLMRPADFDAVPTKAAERGSLTSLPDLIRRATRLASNLERGRTASRLGMDFWEMGLPGKNNGVRLSSAQPLDQERAPRRSDDLSDMLSSFPPPGLTTPNGEKYHGVGRGPSNLNISNLANQDGNGRRGSRGGRRCCGMPMGRFLLVMLILLLLVAAAIIVPVVLIVLPRMHKNNDNSNTALGQCQKELTCENGGTNVLINGQCHCVCINGFTGTNCMEPSDPSCSTMTAGSVDGATIGNQIEPIVTSAQSDFNLPLNATEITAQFSAANLSCTSENALVTFQSGQDTAKRSLPLFLTIDEEPLGEDEEPSQIEANKPLITPSPTATMAKVYRRQNFSPSGLLTASGNPTETLSVSQGPNSLTFTSTVAPSATASPSSPSNATMTSFAKAAVLFVLQNSTQLSSAVDAQQAFQEFFSGESALGSSLGGTSLSNLTLGNSGFTANLTGLTLLLPNHGGLVGGTGST